jgi:uncharacterized ParB-like nuclease family protein
MKTETIKIADITLNAGTQSRVEISEERVSLFCEIIEEIGDMDPISLTSDGLHYWPTDGFHRIFAYQRAGREYIEAIVTPGTLEDAIRRSLSANSRHGMPRTNADRRNSVNKALDHPVWSKLPTREIGKMCDVSHVMVAKMIKERAQPPKEKPVKLKNVVEAPLEVGENPNPKDDAPLILTNPADDMVQEVVAENEQLKDRLAVAAMDATDEEKQLAKETIDELRSIVKNLNMELDAVKKSRDQYQRECTELKKQVKMYQNQLKKMA